MCSCFWNLLFSCFLVVFEWFHRIYSPVSLYAPQTEVEVESSVLDKVFANAEVSCLFIADDSVVSHLKYHGFG